MKVLIVGGGPAGMIAAISAAKENNEVIIIEKNNELGKKILVTGKGRCNITSSVDISEFKTNFSKVYQNFEGRKSNDSTFFLIYLFSYLQKILPKTKEKVTDISEFSFLNLNGKETSELKKFITKFESKNNSLIHDLFYNFQMSELICSACNHTKINFQGNNVLFLSLYDGKIKHKSLEQCINSYLFTKDKKDDKEFPCSSCGRNNLSHVISIVKLPPVFIINLKRVGEEGMYSHDITIPYTLKTKNLEKLNNFNKEYELVGFIKHYGSADDGHNVAGDAHHHKVEKRLNLVERNFVPRSVGLNQFESDAAARQLVERIVAVGAFWVEHGGRLGQLFARLVVVADYELNAFFSSVINFGQGFYAAVECNDEFAPHLFGVVDALVRDSIPFSITRKIQ